MMSRVIPTFMGRRPILLVLCGVAALVLAFEIILYAPLVLEVWKPYDYWQYTEMGRAVLHGQDPYGPGRYSPLPTILWIFAPLSLLPNWFRFAWILIPFLSVLFLFRRDGIWLVLFTPLWLATSDAMIDGWLLIPLAWLLTNRPVLAGLGAVAMLLKPQVAILTVAFSVLRWFIERDWRDLSTFAVSLGIFCIPAFILNPTWPWRMLEVLPMRADETLSILPLLTSSVWAWWSLGGIGRVICVGIGLAALVLTWRLLGDSSKRAAACQLLNLLFVPVLYAANSMTVLPTLHGRHQVIVLVIVSLGAFILDHALGGFGGGYAFIPLAALAFLAFGREPAVSPTRAQARE